MKRTFVRIAATALLVLSAFALAACGGGNGGSGPASDSDGNAPIASAAIVKVAGYDSFTIEFDPADAPATVNNFCTLVANGYYNGLKFYRFVPGFCMQGGTIGNSPKGGDSKLTPIEGEFSSNGFDNKLADKFGRGVVAMGRAKDPNSATSTFFITLDSNEMVSNSLDGQYAAFGTVDEAGMLVVDRIVADHLPYANAQTGVIDSDINMPVIEAITLVQ